MENLVGLIESRKLHVRKEVCWILSNILAVADNRFFWEKTINS